MKKWMDIASGNIQKTEKNNLQESICSCKSVNCYTCFPPARSFNYLKEGCAIVTVDDELGKIITYKDQDSFALVEMANGRRQEYHIDDLKVSFDDENTEGDESPLSDIEITDEDCTMEIKKEEPLRSRNFVAKHMNKFNKGGSHKSKKSYNRKEKHPKNNDY